MKINFQKGISLIETLIVISIMGILAGIVMYSLSSSRNSKTLQTTADAILFSLEKSKANALSGKNGENQGVKFNSNSYLLFSGSSYNSADSRNITFTLDPTITLTETISNADNAIIFSRLTGVSNSVATVTVSLISDNTKKKNITVGIGGNISVVQ